MSQVLSEQSISVEAFVSLVRAHAGLDARAERAADGGPRLTLSDYEVLLRLSRADDRRMRRVDLAEQVLLTASGITRLLDGLERHGFVERAACDERPARRLRGADGRRPRPAARAAESHVAQIEDFFGARFDDDELADLHGLLERLERRRDGRLHARLTSLSLR